MGQDARQIRREIEQTRSRMGDTVEALGYKADVPSRMKDAVNDRVETVKGSIGDAVEGVKARVGGALGSARSTASGVAGEVGDHLPDARGAARAARRGVSMAEENPLGLALGALAVGMLAGLMAPVTDFEREKIGPVRDDLVERAQHMAGDAVEHGKAVLAETASAALSAAQEHGKAVVDGMQGEAGATDIAAARNGSASTGYGSLRDDDPRNDLSPGV